MRLFDETGKELLLVPCEECTYCICRDGATSWICDRERPFHVSPDSFCSFGIKDIQGYLYKTGETLYSIDLWFEGLELKEAEKNGI